MARSGSSTGAPAHPEDFDWSSWGGAPGGGGGQGGYTRTVTPEEFEQMFGGMGGSGMGGGSFSSFFDTLFGGRGGRGRSAGGMGFDATQMAARTPAQEATVQVTLEEAFSGTTRVLQLADGSPNGTRLEVNIPRGVTTGSKVRMKGAAGQGDIVLNIEVMDNHRYTREGDNLHTKVPVDLYTALLGGEVQVPALDKTVALTIPAGTQNGKTIRLRGLGMPHLKHQDKRGDLLAEVEVKLPTHLSAKEKELFEELRKIQA
ncbi:MAG: J domain-containing protein [Anaerolineales bacterium]|nr:J domain-containing protein [Anaerolineales bacterium]